MEQYWGGVLRWMGVSAFFAFLALALKFGLSKPGLATLTNYATVVTLILSLATAAVKWARNRPITLSELLRKLADDQGLTSSDLRASLKKWDVSTINAFLNGKKQPSRAFLIAFANVIGAQDEEWRHNLKDELFKLWMTGGRRKNRVDRLAPTAAAGFAVIALLGASIFIKPDNGGNHGKAMLGQGHTPHYLKPPGRPSYVIPAPPDGKSVSVAFMPGSNNRLVAANSNGRTFIWTVTPQEYTFLPISRRLIMNGVAFREKDGMMATGGEDAFIFLWKVDADEYPTYENRFKDRGGERVNGVAFSPDGHLLAAGDQDGAVYLWTVATGNHIDLYDPETSQDVTCVAFSPDGRYLAAGDKNGHIYLWATANVQPTNNKPREILRDGGSAGVTSVAFSPDGRYLAAGDADSAVYLWKISDLRHITHTDYSAPHSGPMYSVAFSRNGEFIAGGDADGAVYLWAATKRTAIHTLSGPNGDERVSVAFSSDGSRLVVGDAAGQIDVWDTNWLSSYPVK